MRSTDLLLEEVDAVPVRSLASLVLLLSIQVRHLPALNLNEQLIALLARHICSSADNTLTTPS